MGYDRNEERRPLRADFVRTLDWLLEQKGLSQRTFAAETGLASHTDITRWRSLAHEPRPDTVFAMEDYLGVTPGTLSRTLGYLPLNARAVPAGASDFETMVESNDALPKWAKEILLTTYREIIRGLSERRRRPPGSR